MHPLAAPARAPRRGTPFGRLRATILSVLLGCSAAVIGSTRTAVAQPLAPSVTPPAPLSARGIRIGDVRLPDGVRLRYAEQGDAAGQPVILLHGYSDSWRSYDPVLPLLPRSVRAYALDLRGHGDSDRPATGYAMRDLAVDVIAFMDARGIARATIVGHSMGSFVAQQVAVAAPDRVERLVLIGSGTTPRQIVGILELKAAIDAFDTPDAPVPAAFAREFQESTIHHAVPAAFVDGAVAASRKLPVRVWRALMDGMLATDVPAVLRERRIPTLLLWGERDAYWTRSEQDALVRLLGTATLTVYPETGHALHWERPETVARDLVAFLARPARP
jgi:pimeloyl-ACP methyl ester carboxylesterase